LKERPNKYSRLVGYRVWSLIRYRWGTITGVRVCENREVCTKGKTCLTYGHGLYIKETDWEPRTERCLGFDDSQYWAFRETEGGEDEEDK
jgi:hypothetical protein